MTAQQHLETDFQTIRDQLAQAQEHLSALQAEMDRLQQAGMYSDVPTESWQDRNGSGDIYLYMLFPLDPYENEYNSPNGKKKFYVGCKPDKIKEARVLAARRKRYNALHDHARRLADWIAGKEQDLSTLAQRCGWWNRADAHLLGPDPADLVAEFDPKADGSE